MYLFFIGLFLAAFHVTCNGAPEHVIPLPRLPMDVSQEEKLVEKRAVCVADRLSDCAKWAAYCNQDVMQKNCYATCNNCKVQPTPVPTIPLGVDVVACLKAHNSKRALHQDTPALAWDDTLAAHAQTWADHMAATEEFRHSGTRSEGENLAWYWYAGSTFKTCADAVELWYSQISDYDFNSASGHRGKMIGYFTQVVWKRTTRVGVGLKIVKGKGNTQTYIVARYSPLGNVRGQFASNVKPLK